MDSDDSRKSEDYRDQRAHSKRFCRGISALDKINACRQRDSKIIPLALNVHVNGTFHAQTAESGVLFCIFIVW